ncbi:hypothetical protein IL306_009879 [Fusarium sp. DS 682]|nr:hypothetical protein IL306_009879 [Fusarium sp. DS 682]
MANDNDSKNDGKQDENPISKETREDLRRMTQSLTDQATIETLSRAGAMAKTKREQWQYLREKGVEAGEKKKEAEESKDGCKGDKDGGKGDKDKNKKQT